MIEHLITIFDAAADAPVATRHGIAMGKPPMVQVDGADHKLLFRDQDGPFSYWRRGNVTSSPANTFSINSGARFSVPLRLVLVLRKDCGVHTLLTSITSRLRGSVRDARAALGVIGVEFASMSEQTEDVAQQEGVSKIPLQRLVVAIDMTVTVITSTSCLPSCGEPVDILCKFIDRATNAQIVACLGDRLEEICGDAPVECVDCNESPETRGVRVLGDGASAGDYPLMGDMWVRADGWYIVRADGYMYLFDADDLMLFYAISEGYPWNAYWFDAYTGEPGPEVACIGGFPSPWPEPPACVCPARVTLNGDTIVEVANTCVEPYVGLEIRDQNNNLVPYVFTDGFRITVQIPDGDMPYILPYDDRAAAEADTSTVPTELQAVLLRDTKRQYPGNGANTVAELIASGRFLIPATDDGTNGLVTTVGTTDHQIQTNEI